MTRSLQAVAASLLICALTACRRGDDRALVTVVTTPDLAGNGIVTMLAERFSEESKAPVRVLVTEERLVGDLVRDGIGDVVVTSARGLERGLRASGKVLLAQTIAYNDYLLVGPKRDPARAKSAKTAAEALRRIARRDRAFCSPVDVPELRWRESLLWEESPADPEDDRRYRACSGTPLEVLQEASRLGAYTLTDRATFETVGGRRIELVPLLQGSPMLKNDLRILLVRAKKRHPNAEWLVQWTMSYRGRDSIERYRFDGGRRWFVKD